MRTCLLFVLSCLVSAPVWGQSQSITLSGRVTDPSGAVVPRVKVQLVNADTGESWNAVSNGSGNYAVPLVKPGRYNLTAEAQGFKQYNQTGFVLETGVPARADFSLEVGAVNESVTVEANLPLLQSDTAAVGMVVDRRTVASMPLSERRAAQLARLSGFVVMASPTGVVQSGPQFAMAGGRGGNTTWLIDGGNAQFISFFAPGIHVDPPIESMQEFNVSISNYAAELGRTGGGVVQITTRSGTNQFHGSAYEFFRNDKLDAQNFFSNSLSLPKPVRRDNLFGTSFGGPIRNNKAYFFFNYEGARRNTPGTAVLNIPTSAEVGGDFSRSATIVRDPQAAGRPPFPGNVIPPGQQDPVGAKLASFFPQPNVPGRLSGDGNFARNRGNLQDIDSFVARLDYNRSERDRVYGRLLTYDFRQHVLPIFPSPGIDPAESFATQTRYNASGTWLHHFAPTTINELRFTFSTSKGASRPGGFDLGVAEQIGLLGTNPRFPPQINLGGRFSNLGVGGGFRDDPMRFSQIIDNVTSVRGNHTVKFGYEWRPNLVEDVGLGGAGGLFTFGEQATQNSLASLLLGWVLTAQRNETLPLRYRSLTMSGFVQDDWKVNRRLTLNLGLRWDWDQPRWEELGNRQSSFDRFAINPVSGTPGTVTFTGRNGLNKFAHQHDWNNFGPRVGFAFRPTDNWVIRGGGAIVYAGEYAAAGAGFGQVGFSITGNFASLDNGITPPFLLRNGLPATQPPAEADLTAGFGAVATGRAPTLAVGFFEPKRRSGYLETFNFNIQRRLTGNLLVEAGYLGTLGHKLVSIVSSSIDQLRPESLGPGNRQNLRPFPQFTNVQVANPADGNSNYHAMNLRIEKRYSRGLQFQANYTWSRLIDDSYALSELGIAGALQNIYDRRGDRGLSGNHISHRFIGNSVYELPLRGGPTLRRQILGGWSTGLIAEFRSGPAYGVNELVNLSGSFSAAQRPNVVGDPKISGDRLHGEQVAQWFNPSAFAPPAPFTFGNAGRISGYGPGAVIMDLSILKTFHLAERHSLEFRTEMLNLLNHANFALQQPNLARGSASFGRITGLAPGNQSRIVQLGLRYSF